MTFKMISMTSIKRAVLQKEDRTSIIHQDGLQIEKQKIYLKYDKCGISS